MTEAWFILTKRYGEDVRDPSQLNLQEAVSEIVDPAFADDVEHPDTWVRYGHDEGPMYVLTYSRSRRLSFEQWADQDYETELAPPSHMLDVAPAVAERLMWLLGSGELAAVQQEPWKEGT